jgi:hypothetical protein
VLTIDKPTSTGITMKKKLLIIAAMACIPALLGAADRRAKTDDGKEVILRDDGTWIFANETTRETGKVARPGVFVKAPKSTLAYKGKRGTFAMHLVPNIWKKTDKPSNPVAEVEFIDGENDAYAMVIAERISIPLEALKSAAIQNMRAVDNEAAIVKEEKRVVNGKPMLAMIMNVKTQGAAFTFYSYYYTGDEGSFQVVTWTGQNLFKELQPELEDFLNGFEITKK